MKPKNLPPLAAQTIYRAADFESFEYFGSALTGSKPILRLHLRNTTIIDLPTTNDELKRLAVMLIDAFPSEAMGHVKARGWLQKSSLGTGLADP